jgi:hypothetical protein
MEIVIIISVFVVAFYLIGKGKMVKKNYPYDPTPRENDPDKKDEK